MKIIKEDANTRRVFISAEDKDIDRLIEHFSHYDLESFMNKKETLQDYFMKFYKEEKDYGGQL